MDDTQPIIDCTQALLSEDEDLKEDRINGYLQIEGKSGATKYNLQFGENCIGRNKKKCSIYLPEFASVSKEHAVITVESDGVTIKDLGSTNKTKVNKLSLKRNQLYVLQGGETIQFGDVLATYFTNGGEDEDSTDDCASNTSESLLATISPDDPINALEQENDDILNEDTLQVTTDEQLTGGASNSQSTNDSTKEKPLENDKEMETKVSDEKLVNEKETKRQSISAEKAIDKALAERTVVEQTVADLNLTNYSTDDSFIPCTSEAYNQSTSRRKSGPINLFKAKPAIQAVLESDYEDSDDDIISATPYDNSSSLKPTVSTPLVPETPSQRFSKLHHQMSPLCHPQNIDESVFSNENSFEAHTDKENKSIFSNAVNKSQEQIQKDGYNSDVSTDLEEDMPDITSDKEEDGIKDISLLQTQVTPLDSNDGTADDIHDLQTQKFCSDGPNELSCFNDDLIESTQDVISAFEKEDSLLENETTQDIISAFNSSNENDNSQSPGSAVFKKPFGTPLRNSSCVLRKNLNTSLEPQGDESIYFIETQVMTEERPKTFSAASPSTSTKQSGLSTSPIKRNRDSRKEIGSTLPCELLCDVSNESLSDMQTQPFVENKSQAQESSNNDSFSDMQTRPFVENKSQAPESSNNDSFSDMQTQPFVENKLQAPESSNNDSFSDMQTQPFVENKSQAPESSNNDSFSDMQTQPFVENKSQAPESSNNDSFSDMQTQPFVENKSQAQESSNNDSFSDMQTQPFVENKSQAPESSNNDSLSDMQTQPFVEKKSQVPESANNDSFSDMQTQPFVENKSQAPESSKDVSNNESFSDMQTLPFVENKSQAPESANNDSFSDMQTQPFVEKKSQVPESANNDSFSDMQTQPFVENKSQAPESSKDVSNNESFSDMQTQPFVENKSQAPESANNDSFSDMQTQPFVENKSQAPESSKDVSNNESFSNMQTQPFIENKSQAQESSKNASIIDSFSDMQTQPFVEKKSQAPESANIDSFSDMQTQPFIENKSQAQESSKNASIIDSFSDLQTQPFVENKSQAPESSKDVSRNDSFSDMQTQPFVENRISNIQDTSSSSSAKLRLNSSMDSIESTSSTSKTTSNTHDNIEDKNSINCSNNTGIEADETGSKAENVTDEVDLTQNFINDEELTQNFINDEELTQNFINDEDLTLKFINDDPTRNTNDENLPAVSNVIDRVASLPDPTVDDSSKLDEENESDCSSVASDTLFTDLNSFEMRSTNFVDKEDGSHDINLSQTSSVKNSEMTNTEQECKNKSLEINDESVDGVAEDPLPVVTSSCAAPSVGKESSQINSFVFNYDTKSTNNEKDENLMDVSCEDITFVSDSEYMNQGKEQTKPEKTSTPTGKLGRSFIDIVDESSSESDTEQRSPALFSMSNSDQDSDVDERHAVREKGPNCNEKRKGLKVQLTRLNINTATTSLKSIHSTKTDVKKCSKSNKSGSTPIQTENPGKSKMTTRRSSRHVKSPEWVSKLPTVTNPKHKSTTPKSANNKEPVNYNVTKGLEKDALVLSKVRKRLTIDDTNSDENDTSELSKSVIKMKSKEKDSQVHLNTVNTPRSTENEKPSQSKAVLIEETKMRLSKSESVTLSKSESVTQSKSESVTQSKSDSVTQSKSDSVTQSKSDSVTQSKSDSVTQSKSDSGPQSKSDSGPQSKSDSETQSKSGSVTQLQSGSVTQSRSRSITQSRSGSVTQSQPESVIQSQPESVIQSHLDSVIQSHLKSVTQARSKENYERHSDSPVVILSKCTIRQECIPLVPNDMSKNKSTRNSSRIVRQPKRFSPTKEMSKSQSSKSQLQISPLVIPAKTAVKKELNTDNSLKLRSIIDTTETPQSSESLATETKKARATRSNRGRPSIVPSTRSSLGKGISSTRSSKNCESLTSPSVQIGGSSLSIQKSKPKRGRPRKNNPLSSAKVDCNEVPSTSRDSSLIHSEEVIPEASSSNTTLMSRKRTRQNDKEDDSDERKNKLPKTINTATNKSSNKKIVVDEEITINVAQPESEMRDKRKTSTFKGNQNKRQKVAPTIPENETPSDSDESFVSRATGFTISTPSKSTADHRKSRRLTTIESSPNFRHSKGYSKPQILFTGLMPTNDQTKMISRLGGSIVDSVNACTILIAINCKRTVKLMSCVATGIPVVTVEWLRAAQMFGSFPDPWQYILKDKQLQKKFNFDLKKTLVKSKEGFRVFHEKSIYTTDNVRPDPDQMRELISAGGGDFLTTQPRKYYPNIICVTCEEDKHLWSKFKKLKIPIVSTEFVLSGILRGEANSSDYTLQ